ncbi:MAG: fibronectin type III domain-containing protein [Polyangiaceae bacterium]|nr:fibronectin type III domain-containing protein [Polyangiaceae bacterium]
MKKLLPRLLFLAPGLSVLFVALPSDAVGTRQFVLREAKDFMGGDLEGTAIDSNGRVRAGFALGSVPATDAPTVWSALPQRDGSVLLGTGNDGKLLRLRGTTIEVAAETKTLAVTSLVEAWGGTVVLGTIPNGKVFKWEKDKLTELVSPKDTEHVWALAYDAKANAIYAATGPEGKLWRITPGGQAQVYFDAEEDHLMSVAVATDGTVYAGASEPAKLYRLTGPGRATVLYDFGRTEVRGIAVGQKGDVFAIANEISGGASTPKRSGTEALKPASPGGASPKIRGKGVLYHFDARGVPEELLKQDDQHFTSLALGSDGRPYVGTGVEGQVYTVDALHTSVLMADTEERQVGALLLGAGTEYVIGSDPAVVHPVKGLGGPDAVWTSKALDAGIRAQFGRLGWDASGSVEISTRSGNTKEPDDTWSDWSAPLTVPGQVTSAPARFLQLRARFSRDPKAEIREIEVPFLTDNLKATITSIEVKSGATAQGSSDGVQKSGEPITADPDSKVKLSWKTDNPDHDELRFRVEYRLVGTKTWFDLLPPGEKLTKDNTTWETKDLPEGEYRIRVTASDEPSNPPDRVHRHSLESSIVLVDNSAPAVLDLKVTGRRLTARLVDGVGPIQRIEVCRAGTDEWSPFYPADGIFDEPTEELAADVTAISPSGSVLVVLRVYDRAGNRTVRSVMLE